MEDLKSQPTTTSIKNNENVEQGEEKRLTLTEIEYYLENNIIPPGVKEYNDLPPDYKQEPSKSNISKMKKVKYFK